MTLMTQIYAYIYRYRSGRGPNRISCPKINIKADHHRQKQLKPQNSHKNRRLKTWHPPGKSKSPKVQYSGFLGQHSDGNPTCWSPATLASSWHSGHGIILLFYAQTFGGRASKAICQLVDTLQTAFGAAIR